MPIQDRDHKKYPHPLDEPDSERLARLGLREMEPGEDLISWGQNCRLPKPEVKPDQPKE